MCVCVCALVAAGCDYWQRAAEKFKVTGLYFALGRWAFVLVGILR